MTWSIAELARASGVTARTLRHYDEIGLLAPATVGPNGYRYYETVQMLRLQRILLLRQFGMDLATIAAVVNGEHGQIEALRAHHRQLLEERSRLDRLICTVADTILHLEGETDMSAEDMFDGFRFTADRITALEALAVERTGSTAQPHFEEIRNRTRDWSEERFRQVERDGAETERRLLGLLREGLAPGDPAVFAVLDDDVAAQAELLTLDGAEYAALGEAFAAAPELRAHLDAQDPRLAGYLRDAMVAYAAARMG